MQRQPKRRNPFDSIGLSDMAGALNALFSWGSVQFWRPLFHLSYNIELLWIRSDDSCALHIRVGLRQLSEADSMFLDRPFQIENSL